MVAYSIEPGYFLELPCLMAIFFFNLMFKNSTANEKVMAKYKYPLGMAPMVFPNKAAWATWAASAMSMKPMSMRKESASSCIEGCLLIKERMALAKSIIIRIEIITAITISRRASLGLGVIPFVMPTAVSMESIEKIKSITII